MKCFLSIANASSRFWVYLWIFLVTAAENNDNSQCIRPQVFLSVMHTI